MALWLLDAAAAAKSLQSCPILCDPIDGSPPGFLSLGFSRQEHWSGLPFPFPMHESEKGKWSRSVVSDSSDRMDCSLPGSSIHGIFQARVLEWGAIAFSAGRVYIAENIQSIKDWTRLLHYNGKGTYTNSQKYWILILSEFFIGWVSIM